MKYKFLITLETVAWMCFAWFAAFVMLPFVAARPSVELTPIQTGIFIIGAIALGAVGMILAMKWADKFPGWLQMVLMWVAVIVYSAAMAQGVCILLGALGAAVSWYVGVCIFAIMVVVNRLLAHKIWLPLVVRLQNLYMMVIIGYAAASLSLRLVPWVAFAILIVVAVYDALAVWGTKTMQEQAYGLAGLGIVPGVGIVYKTSGDDRYKLSLVGGGDVLFVALIGCVFMTGMVGSVFVASFVGMVVALVGLLFLAKPDRFYPAIPYILAGCTVGIVVGAWLV